MHWLVSSPDYCDHTAHTVILTKEHSHYNCPQYSQYSLPVTLPSPEYCNHTAHCSHDLPPKSLTASHHSSHFFSLFWNMIFMMYSHHSLMIIVLLPFLKCFILKSLTASHHSSRFFLFLNIILLYNATIYVILNNQSAQPLPQFKDNIVLIHAI